MLSYDSSRYFSRVHAADATYFTEGKCEECGRYARLSVDKVCENCGEVCAWCELRYNPMFLDCDPDRQLCSWCARNIEACTECGELFNKLPLRANDWLVCEDCGVRCEVCEIWYPESRTEYIGPCVDGYVCSRCQEEFSFCDNCQCYYWNDETVYDEGSGFTYCADCFEEYGSSRRSDRLLGDWDDRSGGAQETVGWEVEFSDDIFYHCDADDLRPYYGQSCDPSVCAELATHIWDVNDTHAIEGAAEAVDGLGDQGVHHGLHITVGIKDLWIGEARAIQRSIIELMRAHASLFLALSGRQRSELDQWGAFAVTANKYSACNLRAGNGMYAAWEFRLWRAKASKAWILARVGISLALIRAAHEEIRGGGKLTLSKLLQEVGRLPLVLRAYALNAIEARLQSQVGAIV